MTEQTDKYEAIPERKPPITKSPVSGIKDWMRYSVTFKLFSIGFLILILMIPASMIRGLIQEREHRRNKTMREISEKWGKEQIIGGPVLTIPYKSHFNDKEGSTYSTHFAHFLPDQLDVKVELFPEVRARGIYKAVMYNTKLSVSGNFVMPNYQGLSIKKKDVLWERAFLSVGIPDMRGINENVKLAWNEDKLIFDPGIESKDVFQAGISTKIVLDSLNLKEKYTFQFELDLNGSEALSFLPVGKETNIALSSKWKDPSFFGAFLPDDRDISDEGFTADWRVLNLNRNYPQQWKKSKHNIEYSAFGVKLLQTIDDYKKTNRAAKYAIMFIFLSFTGFFFVEILHKTRIHPLQYLLVGISLFVFYLLLLSISEHSNFNFAYLIATLAIVVLVTAYSGSIFRNKRLTLFMGLTLTALYGFLYSLMQLQDYALLMGSLGLFIFLAIVMYFSRNVDWYQLNKE